MDVLIVGAGLSGIGAACQLRSRCPGKSFAILEARASIGGTWDLFRYPGIRSDSDMFTLGYSFKPWTEGKAIADGPAILEYVRAAARDFAVEDRIRFHHRVVAVSWSSREARWHVDAERTDTGGRVRISCGFLYFCTGYYRYDEGYTPKFDGVERYRGTVVHPQKWPAALDYANKKVVVIGSGATAVTLVPALAERAAHVTMLQRSPSHIVSMPAKDRVSDALRRWLPPRLAYRAARWKHMQVSRWSFKLSRAAPKLMSAALRGQVKKQLPPGFDVQTHFKPSYNPWDQRLCLVPDGDLFKALGSGRASIVTDRIDTFTENGIRLKSGKELEADIVVTATGLNLLFLGGVELSVDGKAVDVSKSVAYKGMMLSGVPNAALAAGYTNASWTLKVDLVSEYVCRLINHMDANGYETVTPRAPDPAEPTVPLLELQSGYILRSLDRLPKQGARVPWRLNQDYPMDVQLLRNAPLEDEAVEFARRPLRQG